jgi:hypothetical protein
MDAQELRNLQEAYLEVVMNESFSDELAKKSGKLSQSNKQSLAKQIMYRNLASKARKRASGETPIDRTIKSARKKVSYRPDPDNNRTGLTQKERNERRNTGIEGKGSVTKNPKKLRKQKVMGEFGEQTNIYDIILSHLLDEGYAETQEQAEVIMVNMSEEWRQSIIG